MKRPSEWFGDKTFDYSAIKHPPKRVVVMENYFSLRNFNDGEAQSGQWAIAMSNTKQKLDCWLIVPTYEIARERIFDLSSSSEGQLFKYFTIGQIK